MQNNCGSNITMKVQVSACHSGIFVNVPPGGTFSFTWDENNDCGTPLSMCNGPYKILQSPGGLWDGYTFANGLPLQSNPWGGGYLNICGTASLTNFFTVKFKNNTAATRTYQIFDQWGNPIPGQRGQTWISVGAGQTGTLQFATTLMGNQWQMESWAGASMLSAWGGGNFTYTPGDASVVAYNYNGDGSMATTMNYGGAGTTFPTAGNPPLTYTPPPSVIYSNPASLGSNSPIVFTTNVVAGDVNNTLQTGLGALYSAINNGVGVLDTDERAIKGSVDALAAHIDNLTNALRGTGTTNGVGDTSWTNGVAGSKWTDGSAATDAGNSALAGPLATINDAISQAGAVGAVSDQGGGQTTWEIQAGAGNPSFHISLLSDSSFSTLWGVIRRVWCWLLAAAYLVKIVQDIHQSFTGIAIAARGARVPDFEILGTNALGWGVTALCVAGFLLVYAAALGAVFGVLTGNISWSALFALMSSDPLTGAPSGGLAILSACFPTSLFFGLIGAYIVFRLTLVKVAMIAIGATKFLLGT